MTEKKKKSFGALSDFFSGKLESLDLFMEVLEGVGVDPPCRMGEDRWVALAGLAGARPVPWGKEQREP